MYSLVCEGVGAIQGEEIWRELMDSAFTDRIRSVKLGYLPRLEDVLLDIRATEDSGWLARALVEVSHHRRRAGGKYIGGDQGARSLDEAREAFVNAQVAGDPFLVGLALKERAHWNDLGENDDQYFLFKETYLELRERILAGVTSRFGSHQTRVARLLAGAAALRARRAGDRREQLRLYRDCRELPGITAVCLADLYKLELAALKDTHSLEERETLIAEIKGRTELGEAGNSLLAQVASSDANSSQAWNLAASLMETAAATAISEAARGNRWNQAAYDHIHAGNFDDAWRCLNNAEEEWKLMGRADTGESITRRNRARILAERGDVDAALEILTRNIELLQGSGSTQFPLAIIAVLETLAAHGHELSATQQERSFEILGREVSLANPVPIAESGLSMVEKGNLNEVRLLVAVAQLVTSGRCERPEWLLGRLVSPETGSETKSAWRLGRLQMAVARLLVRDGRDDDAFKHAFAGFTLFQTSRAMTAAASLQGEDVSWLIRSELDDYRFAWALAATTGDATRAAEIAEASRGTILWRIVSALANTDGDIGRAVGRANLLAARAIMDENDRGRSASVQGPGAGDDGEADDQSPEEERFFRRKAIDRTTDLIRSTSLILARFSDRSLEVQPVIDRPTIYCDISDDGHLLMATVLPSGESRASETHLDDVTMRIVREWSSFDKTEAMNSMSRDVRHALAVIGTALVGQSATALSGYSSLRFIPSGLMWSVPVAALIVNDAFLALTWAHSLAPSATDATVLAQEQIVSSKAVRGFLGHGLAGIELERRSLRQHFGDCVLFRSSNRFLTHLRRHDRSIERLVVVSAHGSDDGVGREQYLHLGSEAVAASELYRYRFGPIMVAGSCWLARVHETEGFGPLGVIFPVLARGARAFISGLYSINSRSAAFVLAEFYAGVADEMAPEIALQRAHKKWLQRASGNDLAPDRWAAITCIGI